MRDRKKQAVTEANLIAVGNLHFFLALIHPLFRGTDLLICLVLMAKTITTTGDVHEVHKAYVIWVLLAELIFFPEFNGVTPDPFLAHAKLFAAQNFSPLSH